MRAWEVKHGDVPSSGELITVECPDCGEEKRGMVRGGIGHIEDVSERSVLAFQFQWPCGVCGFKSRVVYVRVS